ncbi:MAG TPA: DNA polymerase IV [Bacteroidetes bacterium]|nr:DNA polymerase IV [Bacteroidota bacterium]
MASRCIFHVDVDAFFASVEQSLNPHLRGRPVIVGGLPHQRGVVHSASYEARACGVKTGMPLSEARRRCPQAVFLKGNFLHYKYVSREILKILQTFSPKVEFTSLDDAYVDMTGTNRRFSHPRRAAQAMQQEIDRRLGVPVSIGIGTSKLISRLASAQHKPRGITYVPPGKEREFLAPLPVSALIGVGRVTEQLFQEMGVRTVGQLARLPKRALEQLLGANGIRLWEFANGIDPREVEPCRLRRQISRETTFEEDTDDLQVVMATLQYLCERIAMKLRTERLACGRVHLRIRYADFEQRAAGRKLSHHTQDASVLMAMVHRLIEAVGGRRVRIRHVHISVGDLEPQNWQPDFFSGGARNEALLHGIDEIRRRYGFSAVLPAKTKILQSRYRLDKHGYILHTPSLSQ